jgi:phosphoribosylformylglycinamidine (FGAM) synthase PurS component
MTTVLDYISTKKQNYDTGHVDIPGDEQYSQSELIHSINCARLSKYRDKSSASDDIIGDYPYDNISKYRIRLEARATDFDPKHIDIEPVDGSRKARVASMIATKVLRKHMRDTDFGAMLDKYAEIRPEYGGTLFKKTKEGTSIVPWENVITDMQSILGGAVIERHYFTPSELSKQGWKDTDLVIQTAAMKSKEVDMKDKEKQETISELIEVWELHAEVTENMYNQAEADFDGSKFKWTPEGENKYVRCQIIVAPEGKDENDEMVGIVMQANLEKESPYKYDARNAMAGRGMGEGIPEELKEHQRWHNFYKTETARAVAIGGKVLFVTDDGNVVDTIYDEGIDHGTIMKVGEGKSFTQASVLPTSVPIYQNEIESIQASGDRVTSSFDTKIGAPAKSGATFRGQFIEDENATSQFLQYREQMGRMIREIVEDWELPDALNKASKQSEIFEVFTKAELRLIDDVIIEQAVIDKQAKIILEDKRPVSPQEQEAIRIGAQTELDLQGSKRSITEITEFIKKEVLGNVVIHTTDEDRSKAVLFESFTNLLNVVDPQSAEGQAIIDKVMDMIGVTREQLAL